MIMVSFRVRLEQAARRGSPIVLACDYKPEDRGRATRDIRMLAGHICAIKLNFHMLLPLGTRRMAAINEVAHECGLESIADIKLNDIDSTNAAAARELWNAGFDAVIVNPIMGDEGLREVARKAHSEDRGIIALCHMSAPQAAVTYEMQVERSGRMVPLYATFVDAAASCGADGVVVGATFPEVIHYCRERHLRLPIFSPGIGVQGGIAEEAIAAGSNYLIVGRSILDADDPAAWAEQLKSQVLLGARQRRG